MRFKKIISGVLSVVMLLSTVSVVMAAEKEKPEAYARYAWDDSKIQNVYAGYLEGSKVEVVREKTKLLQMRNEGAIYAGLNFDRKYFPNDGVARSIAVTVRYYDEYEGAYFTLDYTSGLGSRTAAEKVIMKGDGQFKEYTFQLDECYFVNGSAGYDMFIATWTSAYLSSPGPVYIQSVEVKESFPNVPIKSSFSTGTLGNVLDDDGEKLMDLTLVNQTSDSTITVSGTYEVLTYDYRVVDTGVVNETTIEAKGAATQQLSLNISECSRYFIRTKLNYSGEYKGEAMAGEIIGDDIRFSVVNKFEPDEKPNDAVRTQVQLQFNNRAGDQTELYKMVADIGMSGVREYAMWNQNNANAPFEPYVYEKALLTTDDIGMTKNLAVAYGHPTYGGEVYVPVTPEAIKAMCDYAEWFVTQYGDYIEYYEIWNEPNVYGTFNKNYATPEQYTELVKAIYTRIKSVRPDMKVMAMSTATIHDAFIDSCIAAGILDYCDAISCHPYDWSTNADATGKDRIINSTYRERAEALRKKIDDAGYPDIEISWTELGIRSGPLWAGEVAQASYLVQLMGMVQGDGHVDNIYQFNFVNPGLDDDLGTGESHWGLVYDNKEPTGPYAAKLSYVAMAGYNKFLSDAELQHRIIDGPTSIYHYKRNADGKDVLLMWADNTYDNIGLQLGTTSVEVYDMYSNHQGTVKSAGGTYSFTTTFEPMFVVGNFGDFEQVEPIITVDNARAFAAPSDMLTLTVNDRYGRDLRIEAEARDDVEVVEVKNVVDGKGYIKGMTGENAVNENLILVKVYNGDDLLFLTRTHAVITEPMELKSSIAKVSADGSRNVANVSITNLASENSFSGTVTADFTPYGGKVETRTFDNVKPKETVNVQLNVPESLVQRTFNFDAVVELDYGYSTVCPIRLTQFNAAYTETPPPISGEFDYADWEGGDFFAADREMDVYSINDWSGTSDCSFMGKVKWDEEYMYLLTVVTDDIFYQPNTGANVWNGDGVQFAVSTEEDRKLTSGGSFSEFGLTKTLEGVELFRFESLTGADKAMNVETSTELKKNVLVDNHESSVEVHDGKYIYRSKIPWSEIVPGVKRIENNINLGFSMIVNENDGEGRGWLQFSDGIASTKLASLYSLMTLTGK